MLDVNATRAANGRMRGQAHVAFRDVQTATTAMRALQGVEFVGKGMVCYSFYLILSISLFTITTSQEGLKQVFFAEDVEFEESS